MMKFSLPDSPQAFARASEKYEKRYGKPEGRDVLSVNRDLADWAEFDILLIWHIGESETILLSHDDNGVLAEFQDVSVCD